MCLSIVGLAAAKDEKPPLRTYTNEDLERFGRRRGETGVNSETAASPKDQQPRASERPASRGEEFWRREAERERRRLEPLKRRTLALEQRLEERRRKPGVRPHSDPVVEGLEGQLRVLRSQIREQESRFEDRARRERALPGWLR